MDYVMHAETGIIASDEQEDEEPADQEEIKTEGK